jgi:N-acetylglucosaminyldiphosphoundecaprenol N-acetyl-beta-D-mannosaminyltransferase
MPIEASAGLAQRTRPPAMEAPDAEMIDVLGTRIHNVTREQTFALLEDRIATRQPCYVVTPNVDHLCRVQKDPAFRKAYEHAYLSLPDGMWVLWASRLLGTALREKISGSDLVLWLSQRSAERGHAIFLFGAAEGVAEEAARALCRRFPGLVVKGTYSPPVGFEKDPIALADAVGRIRDSQADVCFVALGSPKQEIWMHQNFEACKVPVMMGIGAGLDFAAGRVKRAPKWVTKSGMEWFWRFCLEPRRLWRRYFVEDRQFLVLLWRALRDKRRKG